MTTDAFPGLQTFLINSPLYTTYTLEEDDVWKLYIYGKKTHQRFDGHCLYCKQSTTFEFQEVAFNNANDYNNSLERTAFDTVWLTCRREDTHRFRYHFYKHKLTIQKIGQFPSLADIAINENTTKYRSVLKGEGWSELYKAIGLAAHGEGIGSFVYLRRVFERLITQRFSEYKEKNGWLETDFINLRMAEKVEFLRDHLPPYLVEVKRIYGIFSLGIHELNNKNCLEFFPVGKQLIILILEDDLKQKADRELRQQLAEAVHKFTAK